MTNQHPITSPPELVQRWWEATLPNCDTSVKTQLCTQAAQWGWDQRGTANEAELQKARDEELEACCEELVDGIGRLHAEFPSCLADDLRAARRPKPPSLKKQALRELGYVYADEKIDGHAYDTIKRALEALPND
jgi:hypothetical protein